MHWISSINHRKIRNRAMRYQYYVWPELRPHTFVCVWWKYLVVWHGFKCCFLIEGFWFVEGTRTLGTLNLSLFLSFHFWISFPPFSSLSSRFSLYSRQIIQSPNNKNTKIQKYKTCFLTTHIQHFFCLIRIKLPRPNK